MVYKVLNIIGVIFTLWFSLTSWIWTYWAALYIGYPLGLISLLILLFSPINFAKQIIKAVLIIGITVSITALILVR